MSRLSLDPELAATKIVDLRCPECGAYTLDTICKMCGVPTVSEVELGKEDEVFESSQQEEKKKPRIIQPSRVIEDKNENPNDLLDPDEI